MQASIGGSARIQGVGNVVGLGSADNAMHPATQAAVILWVAAVVVLVVFHVGGARF